MADLREYKTLAPCDCKGWKESMPSLESAQTLAWAHGQKYTGKQFTHCPWCGKERQEVKDGRGGAETETEAAG